MSWVTIIWSMIASACFTLAAIYFVIWYRNRAAWANLLFSLTAASTTALAFCELWIMRAATPAELLTALTWVHVPLFVWLVSTTWFVRVYLGAGRAWLAWTICGLRALSLLVNLVLGQNVNFREVTALRHMQFLGESVNVLAGVPNRATPVAQFASFLVLVFVADASITAWRRGERRKALMVGGSVELFLFAGLGTAMAIVWGNVQAPMVFSVFYLGLVAVMAYELSRDVLRASRLVEELQASEADVRESEARMSLAVAAADFGIWIRDLTRHQIWASEKWRELFGFTPSQTLVFDDVLQRVHPDDRDALRQAHAMAVAGANGGRYQTEFRLLLPDGAIRWITSRGRMEVDATGQPVLVRGASRDVTGRKHAEQEMQRLRHELAHAGRVSMMGQLASALVHEINQPLGAILRNAEAAALFLQRTSPDVDEVRAILVDIRKDDQRAGAVIGRMSRLLRRRTLHTRQLHVATLVGDVAALVKADAASRHARLEVDVPSGLPHVRGDRVHLQQVLLNLILNGVDALEGTSAENRRIRVSARPDGAETIAIAVEDAGPGIATDALAQIFDPFFTTKPHGMGMGLAISRTIIEAHGGRLWAENKNGGGAAFRFTLEIAAETETAAKRVLGHDTLAG